MHWLTLDRAQICGRYCPANGSICEVQRSLDMVCSAKRCGLRPRCFNSLSLFFGRKRTEGGALEAPFTHRIVVKRRPNQRATMRKGAKDSLQN